jgi:hypothetical protein
MTYNLVSLRVLEVYVVVDDNDLWVGCEVLELPGYVTMYAGVCRNLQKLAGLRLAQEHSSAQHHRALLRLAGLVPGVRRSSQEFGI